MLCSVRHYRADCFSGSFKLGLLLLDEEVSNFSGFLCCACKFCSIALYCTENYTET